jgi:uracil DNA glycosylase
MNPTKVIHPSWELPLHLLDKFKAVSQKIPINPELKHLFRVFSLDIMHTKVVMIGLSPYQKIGEERRANGLAFGSEVDTPSLQIIRQALWKSYHEIAIEEYFDNTMEYWHNQGILMLNASLSVPRTKRYGTPKDHLPLWNMFIREVLKDLLTVNPIPIWFMGNEAKALKTACKGSPLLLESCHPVATAYQRKKYHYNDNKIPAHLNFTLTENFKRLDKYFIKLNGEPLKWLNYEGN